MINKLALLSLSSNEVDLESWTPSRIEDVFVSLDIEVGFSDGHQGSNLFYVTLATPEALRKHRKGAVLSKNRTLIVDNYLYKTVKQTVSDILDSCSIGDWESSCIALQRYFQWEYEDYQQEVY